MVFTHAGDSCGGLVIMDLVCLCVCFLPHDISKTAAARITKLEMFHRESWKHLPMWPSGQPTWPPCAVEPDALSGRGSRLSSGAPPTKNYF